MSEPITIDVVGLQLTIRPLVPHELGQLVALTSSVRWEVSLDELEMMQVANPEGFIGAFLNDGTLTCHVSLIKHSDSLAYLGIYITSAPYRGRGIGRHVFQYAIDLAGKRTVTLDALIGKTEIYQKFGFKLSNVTVIHICGLVDHDKLLHQDKVDFSVQKVTPVNVDCVMAFDEELSLINRSNFLKKWLLSDNSVAMRAVNGVGKVVGFIVIRPDHVTTSPNSFKIGGLYANEAGIAYELLCCALDDLPDKSSVWSEFPSTNETSSLSLYTAMGFKTLLDYGMLSKMTFGGEYPSVDWTKVYALTNTFNTFI